jgi:hypothetical protein
MAIILSIAFGLVGTAKHGVLFFFFHSRSEIP